MRAPEHPTVLIARYDGIAEAPGHNIVVSVRHSVGSPALAYFTDEERDEALAFAEASRASLQSLYSRTWSAAGRLGERPAVRVEVHLPDVPQPAAADRFNILGKPVPAAAVSAAFDLAVAEGLPPEEANIVLPIVAREIAHDEPERAIRTLRRWVSEHGQGTETFVIRLLAVLGTVGR